MTLYIKRLYKKIIKCSVQQREGGMATQADYTQKRNKTKGGGNNVNTIQKKSFFSMIDGLF